MNNQEVKDHLRQEQIDEEKLKDLEDLLNEDKAKVNEEATNEEATNEDKSTAEDDDLNTKYLRLMADFQNFRRRSEKEKSDIYSYANEKLVVEILAVMDNFERALNNTEGVESFAEGMSLILKQLKNVLEKTGVAEMNALGEEFDPNFHHAVLTEDSNEYESGKVTEVLQKGYLLNNKVVRPAMVKVAE